jgi:hypothetical protein
MHALEGVFAEHIAERDAIEKSATYNMCGQERERKREFFSGTSSDDDDSRSIRTIVPHELESRRGSGPDGEAGAVAATASRGRR